jgi:hypothetical protein
MSAGRMMRYQAPVVRHARRAARNLGDSPAVAMPNGQPTPPASAVAEAQAALGYWFQKTTVSSGLTPAWSQSDVDGVYGARTMAALKAMQTFQNGNGNTLDDVDTTDGSLTTSLTNEAQSPFDTLNFLRAYVELSIAPAAMPYTFWGQAIQSPGTPVLVPGATPPSSLVTPTPGSPPGSPSSTTSTATSSGTMAAIVAGVAIVAIVGGVAIYRMQEGHGAALPSKSATARVVRRQGRVSRRRMPARRR